MTYKITTTAFLALAIALSLPAASAAQTGDLCLTTAEFANTFELEITSSDGDFFNLVGFDTFANDAADGGAVVSGNTLFVEWSKPVTSNGQVAHYNCHLDVATMSGPGKLTRIRQAETLVDDVQCEPCAPLSEAGGRPSDAD